MATSPSKGHILVVEKNDITRKLIVGILSNKGYDTYEALDGGEALAFLSKEPLLVVLDVEEDNIDSIGFIHKMQMEHRKLPMVAMTSEQDKAAVKKRLGLEKVSILEKPVMPENCSAISKAILSAALKRRFLIRPKKQNRKVARKPILP